MEKETKKCCENCNFWRDKGWGDKYAIGICDNKKVIAQVKMMSEIVLEKFVVGENKKEKKSNARFIANSLRFRNDFCCNNFKKASWK